MTSSSRDAAYLLRCAVRCWEAAKARYPNDETSALDELQRACIAECGSRALGLSLAIDAIYAGPSDAPALETPVGR